MCPSVGPAIRPCVRPAIRASVHPSVRGSVTRFFGWPKKGENEQKWDQWWQGGQRLDESRLISCIQTCFFFISLYLSPILSIFVLPHFYHFVILYFKKSMQFKVLICFIQSEKKKLYYTLQLFYKFLFHHEYCWYSNGLN